MPKQIGVFSAGTIVTGVILIGCSQTQLPAPIRDADNRIVIYHGVNVSNYSKYGPGFLPWQTKEDFARLNNWGLNFVRYLVFWEAIEPVEGQYDEAYLDATVERIQWLNDLGIDVLIDLHQDLYSRKFGGDGFPNWALNDNGLVFTPRQPWNLNYLEPAVIACFDNFWASDALRTKYIAMLEHLMQRVDSLPNVVGIDIMNEPFGGSHGDFEWAYLSQFYADVAAMRQSKGFHAPLHFEPYILTSAGLRTYLDFTPPVGSVYAPHYYELLTQLGLPYGENIKGWTEKTVQLRVEDARRFGAPLLFGEFGNTAHTAGALDYVTDFLDLLDQYHAGWAYWSYDVDSGSGYGLVDQNGNETELLHRLIRTYPLRIAGDNPVYWSGPGTFDLIYTANQSTAPTVIYMHTISGVRIWINGQEVQFDGLSKYLSVQNQGGPGAKQTIHIEWSGA